MCECLDYEDGTRHTCEACVGDLELMRERLAEVERENVALREACEAVLMFYQAVDWGEKSRNRWAALTGSKDATTRVMCDTVRRALGQKESERG